MNIYLTNKARKCGFTLFIAATITTITAPFINHDESKPHISEQYISAMNNISTGVKTYGNINARVDVGKTECRLAIDYMRRL